MRLKPNDKILFIGDSITDCGRNRAPYQPYGNGYMSMVRNFLIARHPEMNLTFENRGISGHTIRDLKKRWQRDVLDEPPDFLSIKIGINDVWRFVAGRMDDYVPVDEYEQIYRELLTKTRDAGIGRFLLIDPYVIEPDPEDIFRKMIAQYIEVVHRLAVEFNALSVWTMAAFDRALRQTSPAFWAKDRIHPAPHGHALIASLVLEALEN